MRRGNGPRPGTSPVVITGGAGFVGVNLADRLLADGEAVVVYDNLSRPGVEHNLQWLRGRYRDLLQFVSGDVRDGEGLRAVIGDSSFVYHLAGQVAVTTSLRDPLADHAVNVLGTLNVLEAVRRSRIRPGLLFASTNKVYGALNDVPLEGSALRCEPADSGTRRHGISERQPLDFISPYGCSKGAADQYVLDYCRSYDLVATVLRMSCIYGPRQQATSDQGWVAHFLRAALANEALTIYGDGRQVRDVLYIEDFVAVLLAVRAAPEATAGSAFNIGGGTANTLSLLELIGMAEKLTGRPLPRQHTDARPGDQRWFAADHRRFSDATGWQPRTPPTEGIEALWAWLLETRQLQSRGGVLPREHAG